jgi:hypothetical protein
MPPTLVEVRFFPAFLTGDVGDVARALSQHQWHPPSDGCLVQVGAEWVELPYRVYYADNDLIAAASSGGHPGLIAACLGTRHHDGFLRETFVRRLLQAEEPWIVPYVIQLLGEYVLEIGQVIEQALPMKDMRSYVGYARSNAPHLEKLQQRAVSYWNAYYRATYPSWRKFPACKVLSDLISAARLQ